MSRFHTLEIAEVRRETPDAVSLRFHVPAALAETFRFVPGQYLTLRTTIDGEDCRRSYSICSGADDGELRVAIKRAEAGRFSTWANTRLRAGDTLDVMPPEGRFCLPADQPRLRHVAAFAAGSGITPVLSIIRTVLERDADTRVTLVYGNRTTASIMFRDALEDLKDSHLERFSLFHVLSRESQDIALLSGRLDADRIALFVREIAPPAETGVYLLCGPMGMIEAGKAVLVAAGAEPQTIRSELFTTGEPVPTARLMPRPVPATAFGSEGSDVACILDGITYSVRVGADAHVVDAAHAQGVELPYSCKGGMCCTCRCKMVEGKVVMDTNYSLEPWELAAGYVLACQSRPLTPKVRLDFDQT